MTTTCLTVNGNIRSEQRAGEAHSRDYVLDRLGSVIQIYQNGWPIADACYEPYGGTYTQWNMEGKTFTWLGGWGYRQTGVEWSSVYVRARHYARFIGSWLSVDPLWPSEMAYGYVEGRVMTGVDPSGMQKKWLCRYERTCPEDVIRSLDRACELLRKEWSAAVRNEINSCIKKTGAKWGFDCPGLTPTNIARMRRFCRGSGQVICWENCRPGLMANTTGSGPILGTEPDYPSGRIDLCVDNIAKKPTLGSGHNPFVDTFYHELGHACGYTHEGNFKPPNVYPHSSPTNCSGALGCCMQAVLFKKGKPKNCWERASIMKPELRQGATSPWR